MSQGRSRSPVEQAGAFIVGRLPDGSARKPYARSIGRICATGSSYRALIRSTPEQYTAFIQNEISKWAKVIQAAGIKGE